MENNFNNQEQRQRDNWVNPQPQYQDNQGNWRPNPNYPHTTTSTVGFIDAIKVCFTKYADFNGRAPRAEFWWFMLFQFIVSCSIGLIPIVGWIVDLALLIPTLSVSWRRLHDIGKGGGWWFLSFIPLIGTIILIIWYCTFGEPRPNRFGPNPYGINDGR